MSVGDGHPGPECREIRENAGISLREMARQTHLAPSALSRFENGKSRPHGLDQLVSAYRALPPPDPPNPEALATPDPETRNTRNGSSKPGAVFLALYVARWALFGLAIALAPLLTRPYGSFDEHHPHEVDAIEVEIWRIFLLVSLLGYLLILWRKHRETFPERHIRRTLVTVRAAFIPTVLAIMIVTRTIDQPVVEVALLIWTESGYWMWQMWMSSVPQPKI